MGVIFSCPQVLFAATIHVPAGQATIQAGINAAVNGDTVLVAPGVYMEILDFLGKSILVLGHGGADSTILTYPLACDYLIRFGSGEDTLAILDGFQVRDVVHRLAVVQVTTSSATIRFCHFKDNHNNEGVSSWGVIGVSMGNYLICHDNVFRGNRSFSAACVGNATGRGRIYDNIFEDNEAFGDFGGAIAIGGVATYVIEDNLFIGNSSGMGGAVFVSENNNTVIRNNTFISNISGNGGGVCVYFYCNSINIEKNIFVNNSSAITNFFGSSVFVDYNNTLNNEYGGSIDPGLCSFSADPQFCDTASGNYGLMPTSPCLPENNICGVIVGACGIGCGVEVLACGIDNDLLSNVTDHNPKIVWEYYDMQSLPQDSFELAVGADDDWAYAEMWNPAPVASSDTFVTYAGAPLLDGETYYLRLRVHNGTIWSAWYDTLFRMNSLPSVPSPLYPADEEVVKETFPTLYIQNSSDAEADSLTYDFRIAKWNPLGPPFDPFVDSADNFEGEDSTGWTVPNEYPLEDNQKYFWMARSFDQFEKSGWSDPLRSFWVNTVEEAPWPFDLISPPDTSGSIIFDMLPQFYWRIVTEPDPFDNVTQTLYLAVDSNFQFVQTISDIPFNYYDLSDNLWFGTRYWWKVKAEDANGNATYSSNTLSFRTWKLGDANGDWVVNILDVTFLISALYKGGSQPLPSYVGDANGNCVTNILDATYLIAYLYKSGTSPRVGCE